MSTFGGQFRKQHDNKAISKAHLKMVKQVEDVIKRKVNHSNLDNEHQTIVINGIPRLSQKDLDWLNLDLNVQIEFAVQKRGKVNHYQIVVNPFKEGVGYDESKWREVVDCGLIIGLGVGILICDVCYKFTPWNSLSSKIWFGLVVVLGCLIVGVGFGIEFANSKKDDYIEELNSIYGNQGEHK